MTKFRIQASPKEMRAGLNEITRAYPKRFGCSSAAFKIDFMRDNTLQPGSTRLDGKGRKITLRYKDISGAFRALGTLLAVPARELSALDKMEVASFSMRGIMIDCSRNAVIRPDVLKDYLRRVALMGINMVMLYTEDTYRIRGEPFFGYLRGGFTQAELKDIDRYAAALGIEMIPCIQTLAHMEQVLQWEAYYHLADTPRVLLAGDKRTNAFVEKMILAASAPFRTDRIHIGMDEAQGMGKGRYEQIHGKRDPFDIMNAHLGHAVGICRKLGLKPMIWSDMYFRMGSKTHRYYDLKWNIPKRAVKNIPKDVQLIYWDYEHTNPGFYQKMIAFHRKLGSDPVFAGGIWTWAHQWCALPWSFSVVDASMAACKTENLKEVFMTMWGDDGTEVDIYSALPAIQYFCEHVFERKADRAKVSARFDAIMESSFADWLKAADIDSVPAIRDPGASHANTAKALLWQDPFFSLADPHFRPWEWSGHYAGLKRFLDKAKKNSPGSARLEYPALISGALAIKAGLRRKMGAAYNAGDRRRMQQLVLRDIPELNRAVRDLWRYHRKMWMRTYKPFGWEVLDHRYGGLLARIDTVRARLSSWASGKIQSIPELDAKLHDPWKTRTDRMITVKRHARLKTPSSLK